jgi:hypothetical protein
MHALRVQWKPHTPLSPPLDDLAAALSANPSTPRVVAQQGDVDAALANDAQAGFLDDCIDGAGQVTLGGVRFDNGECALYGHESFLNLGVGVSRGL